MLSKRGKLEIQYIILLIIAIVVLVTIIYFFRSQFSFFMNTVFGIGKDINQTVPPIKNIVGG